MWNIRCSTMREMVNEMKCEPRVEEKCSPTTELECRFVLFNSPFLCNVYVGRRHISRFWILRYAERMKECQRANQIHCSIKFIIQESLWLAGWSFSFWYIIHGKWDTWKTITCCSSGWCKRTSVSTWRTQSARQCTRNSASRARRRNVARSTIRWRRDFLEPNMAILLSYSHLHLIPYSFQVMEQQCSVTNEQKCDTTNEEVFLKPMITI